MQDPRLDLTVTVERTGPDEVLVRVRGELDIRTAAPMLQTLGALLGEHEPELMRLDLSAVRFCDHAGLRALHSFGEVAAPGQVRIVDAHPAVVTILRLCGIGTFLGYSAGAAARTG